MPLIIVVTFTLRPGDEAQFRTLILENAQKSVQLEAGCHRFDVASSEDGREIFLYEIYEDAAAFSAHLQTDHYLDFDAATKDMILVKQVQKYQLLAANFPDPS